MLGLFCELLEMMMVFFLIVCVIKVFGVFLCEDRIFLMVINSVLFLLWDVIGIIFFWFWLMMVIRDIWNLFVLMVSW